MPAAFRISDPRLHYLTERIQATLAERPQTYDIVVVNLPRVVDGSLCRYLSAGFFEKVKRSLRLLGVLVVGIAGDRSLLDGEPAYQGTWVKGTLETVFAQTLLVPDGVRTFFISSAGACLQVSPMILETRFGLIENAGEIFPVESLSSVYRPDLSLKMLDSFDAVNLPGALLVTRIWCRYLCPTGAFLSLFNLGGWLGRFLPAKKFGRCEFGLGGRDHLDCIHCDRRRCDSELIPSRDDAIAGIAPSLGSWAFLFLLLCLAVWTLMPSILAI